MDVTVFVILQIYSFNQAANLRNPSFYASVILEPEKKAASLLKIWSNTQFNNLVR